jgi:large subunit ribosomal protein L25
MVETLVLKANKRDASGTRVSRKAREAGLVPAVVYGHGAEPLAITLNYHDLSLELQHHHRLLQVDLNGKKEQFLVKEIQYDHLGDKVIHLDLTRVDLDERVTVTVTLEFKGIPAGAADGGVLDQMRADIELECLVTNIPENVRVMVSGMNVGDMLLAKDVTLPSGITLVTDAETPIAAVRVMAEEVEEEVEGEASGDEPEVITAREKTEDKASPE